MERIVHTTFHDDLGVTQLGAVATTRDRLAPPMPVGINGRTVGIVPVDILTYRDDDVPGLGLDAERTLAEVTVVRVFSSRAGRYVERFRYQLSPYSATRHDRDRETASLGTALTELLNDALRTRQSLAIIKARVS
jgi:hypothetical protein